MKELESLYISSNSCICSQPITIVGDNPITVPNLTTGVYTVEVTAVNSNVMSIENNKIVEMITLCDKSTTADESGNLHVHMCMCMHARTPGPEECLHNWFGQT